ncbi:hypothetical protein [Chitinophaga nivalis]|uniref:Uncharacterized protein n=1 Tax=Chitinophaga nivalis TaxID=2991709 RepID=A0ABT3IIY8_9BACT|nr:hypothetical protein [Chitinophaga nivalis]MCW3466364.1 hypothetical protein [Chitinophaga nivalis]MCW3483945.1 hypothetical protein [Chitinophaga nivalis]
MMKKSLLMLGASIVFLFASAMPAPVKSETKAVKASSVRITFHTSYGSNTGSVVDIYNSTSGIHYRTNHFGVASVPVSPGDVILAIFMPPYRIRHVVTPQDIANGNVVIVGQH